MDYKVIIFDFDGILNDTEGIKFEAWQLITKNQSKRIDKQFFIEKCCGKSGEEIAKILIDTYGIKGYPKDIAEMMKNTSKPLLLKKIKPIKSNINFLKQSYKKFKENIGLATSQDLDILLPSLRKLKIEKYFKEIVAGHEIKHMKPAPDIYLAACKKLKVKPKEAIVIEDSQAGIESAYNAGIGLIVAIPGEFTNLQDFSKAHIIIGKNFKAKKAQKHLNSINQLLAIIN